MYYADIKYPDIANGLGVRVSLFVSGCRRHCPECFNKEAQDFKYGKPFTNKEVKLIGSKLELPQVRGLTLLGGEPMEIENVTELLPLCEYLKSTYTNKDIWCYTGYTYEELMNRCNPVIEEILKYIDVLVDGNYEDNLHDPTLKWKGSSNQRVIDVQKSLKNGGINLLK